MQQQWISVDGRTLWSESTEPSRDSPTILLIAGANASAMMWPDAFVDALAQRGFQVLRYDHRDTGQSTHCDFAQAPYSIGRLAADAVAVLDGWGVQRAHIVGFSMGTTLAQVLALDAPDRLCSMTLMCGAALDVDFVGNIRRSLSGEEAVDALPLPRRDALETLAARAVPASTREDELARRVREWQVLCGADAAFDAADFRAREERAIAHAGTWHQSGNHALATPVPLARGAALRGVQTPTLVIQAMRDPLNPPPHGRHLAELLPVSTLLEVEAMGHCLPSALFTPLATAIADHARGAAAMTAPPLTIRQETPGDASIIRAIHEQSFPTSAEADLVDALRADGDTVYSLVAERDGVVVGHVLFSRMRAPFAALGLAPVAVRPDQRRQGIAAALITHGLALARTAGWQAAFVLGDTAYYARFGFDAQRAAGFSCPFAGPHFMVVALQGAELPSAIGAVDYAKAFHA